MTLRGMQCTSYARDIEIMAPAGSYAMASAAIRAGAKSVYFGVGPLNMRSHATGLTEADLPRLARLCRWCGVKSYLTLNTIVYDEDMPAMRRLCDLAKAAGVSAIIATDIAALGYARAIGLEVHMSVQANVANLESVRFYAAFADVVVLARELTLEQIRAICEGVRKQGIRGPSGELVRIEVFVHGALCVAVSGKCGMSLALKGRSGNRGACTQPCRRRYRVTDDETGDELVIDNEYVMSPRDICLIEHLDQLLGAGVSVLKIEGRGRNADYVSTVVSVYHEALAALDAGEYTPERKAHWVARLQTVYNRKFWSGGHVCGKPVDDWSASADSQATLRRRHIGTVANAYHRLNVIEFRLFLPRLAVGDLVLIEGPTTGAIRHTVEALRVNGAPAEVAAQGDTVTLSLPAKARRADKVYLLAPRTPEPGDE